MKRIHLVSFIVIIGILLIAPAAYGAKPKQVKPKAAKPAASSPARKQAPPDDSCKAFAVMEVSTGKILESENLNTRLAPASITKLMVADIIMDKLSRNEIKLTDTVTVSSQASKIGGSQVYLKAGEVFTLEEMMKAMMIASANDAAYAIAEHVGGSREEFVALMNERAKVLSMNESEFHSPHGLPPSAGEKEDLVSCNDLLILAKDLLKYPKLLEWTGSKSDTFRNGTFGLTNTNKLLTHMSEVDGLKTGFYREAGFSIVATAKRGDLRFIAVVMGCPTNKGRDKLAAQKLKTYFSQFKPVQIVKKGDIIDKEIILEDGKFRKIKGTAATDFSYAVQVSKKGDVKKEYVIPAKVPGEIKEGQKLGEILIKVDNQPVGKVDIVSPVYVPKANLFTRLIRKMGLNL